jgi:hypothetical protein
MNVSIRITRSRNSCWLDSSRSTYLLEAMIRSLIPTTSRTALRMSSSVLTAPPATAVEPLLSLDRVLP